MELEIGVSRRYDLSPARENKHPSSQLRRKGAPAIGYHVTLESERMREKDAAPHRKGCVEQRESSNQ